MKNVTDKSIELVGTVREYYRAVNDVELSIGFDFETRLGRATENLVNLAINQFAEDFGMGGGDIDVVYDFILSYSDPNICIKTPNGHIINNMTDFIGWVESLNNEGE